MLLDAALGSVHPRDEEHPVDPGQGLLELLGAVVAARADLDPEVLGVGRRPGQGDDVRGSGSDFAYTVLLPDRDEVIGCVYFKPTSPARPGAVVVRSWVTAEHSDLDEPLYEAVTRWLAEDWPLSVVEYAPRRSGIRIR